jgi:hypothetical protein
MKIRLLAPDSKIPNIATMKISSYHKKRGDNVEWYEPLFDYEDTDILYISKVFTFSEDYNYLPKNAKIIKGGTGYDITKRLPDEIEKITELDYSLYHDCDYSIQFLTRGCVRNCGFCLVRQKEGITHKVEPLELNPKGKYIKLLDNNFFSYQEWKDHIELLKSYNQPIDFNTGIDLRTLTEEQARALGTLKIKSIHCAWDNYKDKKTVLRGLERLIKYVKPYKITCYVLVGFENKQIIDQDIERVMILKEYKVNPFAMGYIDFDDPSYRKSQEVKDFCRWVNMKATFKSCSWNEYSKRKKIYISM